MTHVTFPKPEPRKRAKARAKRQETAVLGTVYEQVHARKYEQGGCRVRGVEAFGPCAGRPFELAHLEKRSQTRGMAPEARHNTRICAGLCSGHHRTGKVAHEAGTLLVDALTDDGADGPLRWSLPDGRSYTEPR